MTRTLLFTSFLLILFWACQESNKKEQYKKEVFETEMAFAEMASREGVATAFLYFSADDAVLNRNDKILEGKAAIQSYFENQTLTDVKLEWAPDFIDVSASGDLAYTYGKYTFSAIDTSGEKLDAKGIFHTVWKRQFDGTWRFVYD